jgi:hypothetical protein
MMTMLLIAGIAVLAAGLLAVAFGIPVKEFSFGNTLILAGAVAACTGAILLGLAMVVRELQNLGRRLGAANPAATGRAKGGPQHVVPGADQPASANPDGAEPAGKQPSPTPWQEDVAARDRGRGRDSAPEAAPPEPAAATKPRRNLLFSSSSRRERERASAPDAPAADPGAAPSVAPPAQKEAPATFEDAWPQSDRARSDALRRTRTPSTFAEPKAAAPEPAAPEPAAPEPAAPEPAAPTARSEEPAPVTVLKSGVVDGMAYSLYSDGSIEAQMPEGMMRFASIDELRSHLDQRP